jgi:hypothetical protein
MTDAGQQGKTRCYASEKKRNQNGSGVRPLILRILDGGIIIVQPDCGFTGSFLRAQGDRNRLSPDKKQSTHEWAVLAKTEEKPIPINPHK